MKKKPIMFCIAFAALGFMAFGFMNRSGSQSIRVETSVNEDLAFIGPLPWEVDKRVFSDFIYNIRPIPLDKSRSTTHLAVVPEKQAEYEGGKGALMNHLKENSKEARTSQQMDELKPFKLFFKVTKKGAIENIKLDGTSGYLSIDNTMMELITNAPGKWEPAENAKGEKVDQELVVSFGLTGC